MRWICAADAMEVAAELQQRPAQPHWYTTFTQKVSSFLSSWSLMWIRISSSPVLWLGANRKPMVYTSPPATCGTARGRREGSLSAASSMCPSPPRQQKHTNTPRSQPQPSGLAQAGPLPFCRAVPLPLPPPPASPAAAPAQEGTFSRGFTEGDAAGGYLEGVLLELQQVGAAGAQEVHPPRGVGVGVGDALVGALPAARGERYLEGLQEHRTGHAEGSAPRTTREDPSRISGAEHKESLLLILVLGARNKAGRRRRVLGHFARLPQELPSTQVGLLCS